MSTIAELNIDITGSTAGLKSSMEQAASMADRFGRNMRATGRTITAGLSAPLGAISGLAVHAANSLNESLGNVQSLGVTQDRIEELRSTVKDLAVSVGKDTTDLSDGLYQVVSAFGDSAETATILEINAKAAAAGLATTTDAINLTSAVTKGYGDTSADAIQHVSDLAFTTVRLGQTTFPELASSMGRVVPLGSAMGASMEELFGVMATGTGVTGSAAEVSTQLRGVLQSLAAPTMQMNDLIKSWGYSSGQAAVDSMGLQGVIEGIVNDAKASHTPLQKYISSIEGQTLALALAGPQADAFTEKLAAMQSSAGATEKAFHDQTQGVNAAGFAMKQLKEKASVIAQTFGSALLPALSAGFDLLSPLVDRVQSLADKFANMNPKAQMAVGTFVGFLIALGPALLILGQVVTAVSALGPVFAALGGALALLTGPLGLVIAGFAALYGFNLFGFRDMINGLADSVVNFAKSAGKAFGDFSLYIRGVIDDGDYLNDSLSNLPEAFQPVAEAIGRFIAYWDDLKSAASDAITAIQTILSGGNVDLSVWEGITDSIASAFGLSQETADAWAVHFKSVGDDISSVAGGIKGAFTVLRGVFTDDLDVSTWTSAATAIDSAFGQGVADKVLAVSNALKDVWDSVKGLAGSEELSNLGATFESSMSAVGSALKGVFTGDLGISDLKSTVVEQLNDLASAAKDVIDGEAFANVKSALAGLLEVTGLSDKLASFKETVSGFADVMSTYLEGPLGDLKASFDSLSTIDITPITDGLKAIKDAFDSIFSGEGSGAGFDLVAALGITALQAAIEGAAAIVQAGIDTLQAFIDTAGNMLTLFGRVASDVRDIIDGLLNGDVTETINGVQGLVNDFVDFLTRQVEIVSDLSGKIADAISGFVGATLTDIGITLNEPDWIKSLLDWVPDTPEWVTSLTSWEWDQPEWVSSLMSFKFPRPGWLSGFESIVDKITGWKPSWIPHFQMGTPFAPGGLALVGERGPELVQLPRGSRVWDTRSSEKMLGDSGGVTVVIQNATIRDTSDVYRLAEEIDAIKRRRR